MKHTQAMILLSCAAVLSLGACSDKDAGGIRKDSIEIHALADCSDEPLTEFCVNVLGGEADLYVKSDVADFDAIWQDAAGTPWAEVASCENVGDGIWHVVISYAERSSDCIYYRRGGTLTISSPENYLGNFLNVYQGAGARVQDHFSDFVYGSWDPQITDGETHISKWSNTLEDKGFTSVAIAPDTLGCCYAKNGYLKLGDAEGRKGNLLTPYNELYRYDSLLMVTFAAAAYQDATGAKDDNKFTVEIVGGGVLRDDTAKTSITLEAPYVSTEVGSAAEVFPAESRFCVFFTETQASQLSVNTRIKFTSGASGNSSNARLFIDDVCVMRLVDGLDEDFYTENQGSGKDMILASRNN